MLPNPKGYFDSAKGGPGQVTVKGWTFDPNDKRALSVHIYVGGKAGTSGAQSFAITANKSRPDVNKVYPGVGDYHGFSSTLTTSKRGSQEVCAYAINVGPGSNKLLGCKTVTVL